MVKAIFGLLLGFLIGMGCRFFDVPLPGPTKFIGALVIASITAGYLGMDILLARHVKIRENAVARLPPLHQRIVTLPDISGCPLRSPVAPTNGSGSWERTDKTTPESESQRRDG